MNEPELQIESPAQTNSETDLPEPHFDEISIAIAQPVEPLPGLARGQTFGALYRYVSTRALLFILAAALGFATVAFGFDGVRQRLGADETQAEVTPGAPPSSVEPSDASATKDEKNVSSRTAVRKTRSRPNDSESRPMARKVGEIVYRN